MALIKCPDCGKEISDRAASCPNCGCPIEVAVPENSKGKQGSEVSSDYVVIHGYEETFAIDVNMKIYKDGELVGEVAPASEFKLPVDGDCELKFKSGLRSRKVKIRKGIDTNVFLSFDRFSGSLKAYVASDDNKDKIVKLKKHNSSKAILNSIILIVVCAVLAYLFMFVFK